MTGDGRTRPRERNRLGKEQWQALMRATLFMLSRYKLACAAVTLAIIGTSLATLIAMLFMRSLVDDYIIPLSMAASPDFGPLAQVLLRLSAILAVGVLLSYAQKRIMVNVGQGTMHRLRVDLFSRMEGLPIRYFDTHAHGDIMSVYTNDVDTLYQLIGQSLPQFLNSFVTMVSAFISMLVLDVPLSLVSLAMAVIMFFSASKLGGLSARYFSEQQKNLGRVNAYIEEMMEGQKVIKAFCREAKCREGFGELNEALRESACQANKIANITMPVSANLGNISYVLIAILGAVFTLDGYFGLTVGTLIAFLNLNRNFSQPITQLSQQVNSIVMAAAGAARAFKMLDEQAEADGGYVELVHAEITPDGEVHESSHKTGEWAWRHPHKAEGTVTCTRLEGRVGFYDVSFGYNAERQVLHNIEIHAESGQKIALVGSTGSGKTTITSLINRFYDVQDGKIRFDDININKIRKPDLRRSLGVVLQDTHLFSGTVMENIRYGRLDATDEECIEAAKLANADGFISRLPESYQTVLSAGGASLSQGQRQLIAIARAAVVDPPVLILDEATSSIDTRTEALVQRGMDALMKGRTSFVIAHRLSTVRNADCILVMEEGRIIERGTHDELIALRGKYYQLYTGGRVGEAS